MRLMPGYEVYWREPGVSQIGLDRQCAVVLAGLTNQEQRLLAKLPKVFDVEWLNAYGNELGMRPPQVRSFLDRLAAANVLTDLPAVVSPDGNDQYWSLAHRCGIPGECDRAAKTVRVLTADAIGLKICLLLAEAGVGTILVADPGKVQARDVKAFAYPAAMLGAPRVEAAAKLIRSVNSHVVTRTRGPARADITVLANHHVIDPLPLRDLHRIGAPYLPILVRELSVRVGPLAASADHACSGCLDHHETDEDPRWPAVATQANLRRAGTTDTTLAAWAAVTATEQILAFLDGRDAACASATIEHTAWQWLPTRTEWPVHPDCRHHAERSVDADADEDVDAAEDADADAAATEGVAEGTAA